MLILKIIFIVIWSTITLIWLDSASNARNLFNITLEMKEIIYKYLHFNIPIPKITLGKQNSWSLDISHKLYNFKAIVNSFKL